MRTSFLLFFFFIIFLPKKSEAQEDFTFFQKRETLLAAAREIMESARYCALITVDKQGHPQARTMDAFLPDEEMVVWFGTNPKTRKVEQIRNNPQTTLYYQAPDNTGYVTIIGEAYLENSDEEKQKHWKDEWNAFYKDRKEGFILIKVIPKRLEVVSYKHKLTSEEGGWEPPFLTFE